MGMFDDLIPDQPASSKRINPADQLERDKIAAEMRRAELARATGPARQVLAREVAASEASVNSGDPWINGRKRGDPLPSVVLGGTTRTAQAPALSFDDLIPQAQKASIVPTSVSDVVGNLALGGVRGVADIGNTILNAGAGVVGKFSPAVKAWNAERAGSLADLDASKADSTAYTVGRIGGNIAATLPVGGVLAGAGRAAGLGATARGANLLRAIETSGGSAGAAKGALASIGTRAAGGAIAGGASSAIINPDDVASGAAIGAAAPVVLNGAARLGAALGGGVRQALRAPERRGALEVARLLEQGTPDQMAALAKQLRTGAQLVPGSTPTAAQVLQTPAASLLERMAQSSAGGVKLSDAYAAQNAARVAALEGVAPVHAGGAAMAREDLGQAVRRFAIPAEKEAGARVSALFDGVDPFGDARLTLPIEQMQAAKAKYLGAGTFGGGSAADQALDAARAIGTQELPAIKAATGGGGGTSLLDFVKKNGGIRQSSLSARQFGGEVGDLRQAGLGRVVYKNSGGTLDDITEKAWEAGYIPDEDPALLLDLLKNGGRDTFAAADDLSARFQAMSDSANGGGVAASTIERPASFREIQNLRSSIGEAENRAGMEGRKAEAAALGQMKRELDAKVASAADGLPGEGDHFPADVAAAWRDANKAHADKMQRFHTGPQARIFKRAGDGQPAIEGGQVASAFWGSRPGVAADVRDFKRLIADDPALMSQFQSMVATEGAGTATNGGTLGARFVNWVQQTRPGLREAFDADKAGLLDRIAEDIKRASRAQELSKPNGSQTAQLMQNALSAGMLETPMAKRIAGLLSVHGVGVEPVRAFMAEAAVKGKGQRIAEAMADPVRTAGLLSELAPAERRALRRAQQIQGLVGAPLYRGTPVGLLGLFDDQ
jgi:hypothetical protein